MNLVLRMRFNPELNKTWFSAVMELINNVTLLSIVLTSAALITRARARHRGASFGDAGHLSEIMAAKVWAMALVLVTATCSLLLLVQRLLGVLIEGSIPLFLTGAFLQLSATTSLSIFLGMVARSMLQLGLLVMLVLLPLQILSGSITPRESMPGFAQFVMLAHAILYRGRVFRLSGLSSPRWP